MKQVQRSTSVVVEEGDYAMMNERAFKAPGSMVVVPRNSAQFDCIYNRGSHVIPVYLLFFRIPTDLVLKGRPVCVHELAGCSSGIESCLLRRGKSWVFGMAPTLEKSEPRDPVATDH